ncbi:hypothetical protein AG1IA_02349 [Rhizoctonia solani AG-1 IA]|uniref:Uncharacterized protein n=1 Tax=Thanatephorus cucumeris (strain AG1-IA) TaxID=983506 RepID=L8X3L7_THACA|nr:hypothetical protein AG1IA_02349 [Rhizoctonia solani AG-1 IA]
MNKQDRPSCTPKIMHPSFPCQINLRPRLYPSHQPPFPWHLPCPFFGGMRMAAGQYVFVAVI